MGATLSSLENLQIKDSRPLTDRQTAAQKTLTSSVSQAFEYNNSGQQLNLYLLKDAHPFSDTLLIEIMEKSKYLLFQETKLGDDLSHKRQLA